MRAFIAFIREQGIVGLAIGFILGGSISKVVTSFVGDIVNPLIGLVLGFAGNLKDQYFTVFSAKVMWGNFIANTIDFIIIALVVYYGFRLLRLTRFDKKKDKE
jgi:large conductance mechanosensitive channel